MKKKQMAHYYTIQCFKSTILLIFYRPACFIFTILFQKNNFMPLRIYFLDLFA